MLKDRIGTTVNGFYIEDVKWDGRRSYVYVICPYCKTKCWKRLDQITSKSIISCGCYNRDNNYIKSNDLTGREFGRLKVIRETEKRDANNGSVIWECECKCGKIHYVSAHNLLRGGVRSCGCFGRENSSLNGKINGQKIVDNYVIDGTNINNLTAKIPKNNTSGIKGVTWDKRREKWHAQIQFKGKNYSLGYYDKKEDASEIRAIAEKNMFGNFLEWFAKEFPERWERIQSNKKK